MAHRFLCPSLMSDFGVKADFAEFILRGGYTAPMGLGR